MTPPILVDRTPGGRPLARLLRKASRERPGLRSFGRAITLLFALLAGSGAASVSATPADPALLDDTGKRGLLGIALTRERAIQAPPAYRIDPTGHAANPEHAYRMQFDGSGVLLLPAEGTPFRLDLTRFGRGSGEPVRKGSPQLQGGHVTYDRGRGLSEWYANVARGLEQGWTVESRPKGTGPLMFQLDTGRAPDVVFENHLGWGELNYSGLVAYDASGRTLASTIRHDGDRTLRIEVDDRHARYPLTVDPWVQHARVFPADGGQDDRFAQAVAIDGDLAVIGAPGFDLPDGFNTGAAYIYAYNGFRWEQQARLTAPEPTSFLDFGGAVALHGETVLIGARDLSGNGAGSAYIFRFFQGQWLQQARLTEFPTPSSDGNFGQTVALGNGIAFVGAPTATVQGEEFRGAVFAFELAGNDWQPLQALVASDGGSYQQFGAGALALDGSRLLVGSPAARTDGSTTGAAHLFEANGGNWTETARLGPPEEHYLTDFGAAVGIGGDRILVGAPAASVDGNYGQGEVAVFLFDGSDWQRQSSVVASDGAAGHAFGTSVALAPGGDSIFIGSPRAHPLDGQAAGRVYAFDWSYDAWQLIEKHGAPISAAGDDFGAALGVGGQRLLVGAPGAIGAETQTGAAYFLGSGSPAPTSYLSPALLDFDQVITDQSSAPKDLTIRNEGSADLIVSEVKVLGAQAAEFPIVDDACTGQALPTGTSCSVRFAFKPTATGYRSAYVAVTSQAGSSPDHVGLSGIGIPKPAAIVVTPNTLSIAIDPLGAGGASMTIGNSGEEMLSWHLVDAPPANGLPVRARTIVPAAETAARAPRGDARFAAARPLADPTRRVAGHVAPTSTDGLTLTHSSSMDLTRHSVACQVGNSNTHAAGYLRTFTLSDFNIGGDFTIDSVTFGVETLDLPETITLNLYLLDGAFTYSNMTLLASQPVTIGTTWMQLFTVPIQAIVPANSTFVVEIAAPDLAGVGQSFFPGSNQDEETAPSYVSAPACGVDEPTPFADIGAPHVRLVMSVRGAAESCALPPWLGVTPTQGGTPQGATDDAELVVDPHLFPGADQQGLICIGSNDPQHPLVGVSYQATGYAGPARFSVSPQRLDLGEVAVGGSSREATVTLHAGGIGPARVDAIPAVDAPFQRTGGTCPAEAFTLDGGGSCTLSFRFAPTVGGEQQTTLPLDSDAGNRVLELRGRAAPPSGPTLWLVGGDGQAATAGSPFEHALEVRVTNSVELPVAYQRVEFLTPPIGPSATLSAMEVLTDADGRASVTATAGDVTGSYRILARIGERSADVEFGMENLTATSDVEVSMHAQQAFVKRGQMLDYVVTVFNRGPAPSTATSIETALSEALDLDSATWSCASPAGTGCAPSGTGDIVDGNLGIPANSSVVYILSAPVRIDTPAEDVVSIATVTDPSDPAHENNEASATSAVVVHRNGFEKDESFFDGGTPLPLAGVSANLPLTEAMRAAMNTAPIGSIAELGSACGDGSAIQIQRLELAQPPWLRLLTISPAGEMAGSWIATASQPTLQMQRVEDPATGNPAIVRLSNGSAMSEATLDLCDAAYWRSLPDHPGTALVP